VAVAELEGRPVVVSGGRDGPVRVWDLARGTPVGPSFGGHQIGILGGGVTAVAVAELEGRPVVVSGGGDGRVRVWDLVRGTPIGRPLTGHGLQFLLTESERRSSGAVTAVAVAQLEGRPVVVSGGRDGTVRVWDLARGSPVGQPLTGHQRSLFGGVTAVAVAELEGRPVVVSGGLDGVVRVWDLARGTPVGEPLTGHQGGVTAVAVAELEGRPVVVSGGGDGTVRVWKDACRLWQLIEVGSGIYALALAQEGGCVLGGAMGVMSLSLKQRSQ
jgi:WD40 repeat protein